MSELQKEGWCDKFECKVSGAQMRLDKQYKKGGEHGRLHSGRGVFVYIERESDEK